ncbi:MAG: gamma-glutamylcyclotransferase [Eubacteriales bacterium]|nr:gamma-glutamylcyclotransferase [Eubacteriales bacterium]MDD3880724.1 gamma-glutamylcyclotransferase [Eubacteriales bacterium]MDD4511642.1 gamma-glutamylcyclotransferase [Eubacteriales bacterium]
MEHINSHPIFVYGSLMRGRTAEHYLHGSRFIGRYVLCGYAMYDLGDYPGIVPQDGGTVLGEIFEVSGSAIELMDEYEDEGEHYIRREITAQNESGARKAEAYIYILPLDGREHMPLSAQPWGGEDALFALGDGERIAHWLSEKDMIDSETR